MNGRSIEGCIPQHSDECVVLFSPPMPSSPVFLDRPINLPPELALLSVLGAGHGAELISRKFDGREQTEGVVTGLRMQRIRDDAGGLDRRHNDKVATLVHANI